jgi:hypothetical protein
VVFGLGLASTVAPLTDTVVSAVPDRHAGVAAAFNNAVSRGAALLAVALLGVVVAITFRGQVAQQVDNLTLSSAQQQTLRQVTDDPTGAVGVAQVPPEVERVIDQAYTQALHLAMLVSAATAAIGGLVAGLMIRNPPRRAQGETGRPPS